MTQHRTQKPTLGQILKEIDDEMGTPGTEDEYDPKVVKDLIWEHWDILRQGLRDRAWHIELADQELARLVEDDPVNGYGGWRLKSSLLESPSNSGGDYEKWPAIQRALGGRVVKFQHKVISEQPPGRLDEMRRGERDLEGRRVPPRGPQHAKPRPWTRDNRELDADLRALRDTVGSVLDLLVEIIPAMQEGQRPDPAWTGMALKIIQSHKKQLGYQE